ncbi:MAG: gamma-glutamyl-gamma-aminobutyrate hydrolase family protein, partial [Armatimonadetes bacterium]|nr:gamma-glutamyl-gamma-aminobutyrate hydrolase family protein [Armatimonadota bacterium]
DFELDLCRAAAATGLPVLGLCRGAQVMAAARGCSLFADIESECSPSLAHRCAGADAWHTVELDPASRLCRIVGDTHLQVNSSHHQAVDSLDEGVRRVAWSEDGITEAIEWGEGFFLGVQWHPERMENSPSSERLFRAFVEAAASYQRQRGDDQ